MAVNNDLNACSIGLHIIAERWSGAGKYRDAFESIKQSYMDLISTGDSKPRMPLRGLDTDLRATLEEIQKLHPDSKEDFGRIMSDMLNGESSCTTSPTAMRLDIDEIRPAVGLRNFESPDNTVSLAFQQDQMMHQKTRTQEVGVNTFGAEAWQMDGQIVPGATYLLDGFDMDFLTANSNAFRYDN